MNLKVESFRSFVCVKLSKPINNVIFYINMEIKVNEIHFQTLIIFFLHFLDNRSDLDQWSESKRQLQLWNTHCNQFLRLIQYKLKECCLSTCLWWHVQYNCKPLHESSPNLPRQMTFLAASIGLCQFFFILTWSQLFFYCLTVYWCFATAVMTCINSVWEKTAQSPSDKIEICWNASQQHRVYTLMIPSHRGYLN